MKTDGTIKRIAGALERYTLKQTGLAVLDHVNTMTPAELMAGPIEDFIVYSDAARQLGYEGASGLQKALREAWPEVCSEAAEAAAALARGEYV